MRYGMKEIFGLLPMGYLASSSGLGPMMGGLDNRWIQLVCKTCGIGREILSVSSSVPENQNRGQVEFPAL